jgi:hypothetical protein
MIADLLTTLSVFGLFKKKKEEKNLLCGVDLDKWMFLGSTSFKFIDESGKTTDTNTAFFFMNREIGKRLFKLAKPDKYDYWAGHEFVNRICPVWQAGDGWIGYTVVKPSDEFRDYVKKKHNYVFTKGKWTKNTETIKEDNVIKVTF